MVYETVLPAKFISRPNRFLALCEAEGNISLAHVKNTGRCREILLPGRTVYLARETKETRKTKFSLVAADKDGTLINIDSQAPNKAALEALENGTIRLPGFLPPFMIRSEVVFQSSRFDFLLENKTGRAFLEIKGVTLEEDGLCLFPDAPTERGVKHVLELIEAKKQGFGAALCFIAQMKEAKAFTPNEKTHKAFADALRRAKTEGVTIVCYSCFVSPKEIAVRDEIPVLL